MKKKKFDTTVLIVDDEIDILHQLELLVSRRVVKVYTAINGKDALDIFSKHTIDLIISDVNMPVMDGIEFLKNVRESDEDIPFVLSTGLKSLDVLTKAINYGITSFLPKPIQKKALLQVLESVLEKKQIRQELEEAQKLFQQYKSTVDDSFVVSKADVTGKITYVNKLFQKISGYSEEELIGSNHNILRHPDVPKELFSEMWQTITNKKIWQGVIKNRGKNGQTYIVKSTITPILDSDSNIIEFLAMREDVTEVNKRAEELALEKEKFEQVLDNMETIVAIVNNEELTFINKRFFDIFNFRNLEDFLSKHSCLSDLFQAKDGYVQKYMGEIHWINYILLNPIKIHKAIMIDATYSERIFAITVKEIKLGEQTLKLISLNDISELEASRKEVEKSAKAKGEFLANMSHEIRTPMNGILGFTKLLERTELNAKQHKYLDIIDGSANTLLGIINDILDFSKLENGKLELDITKNNPFTEFEKVAMLFMAKAEEKNITFNVEIEPDISKCIEVDLLRMQQVVSNLISNAIKFTPENGKISLFVKVIERTEDKLSLQIGVQDSGIGISKKDQKHIFEAFSQADGSTTRKFGGTGLGLSISAYLVSLMGGKLSVSSEEGVGSKFFFNITVPSCTLAKPLSEAMKLDESAQSNFYDGKILVAEDNKVNQILIKELLLMYGVDATIVENGKKVLERLKKESYDLVFMDINMPVMGGIEALNHMKEEQYTMPVVALTANSMEGDREKFLASGFSDYLSKPIVLEALEKILNTYLQVKERGAVLDENVAVEKIVDLELIKSALPFSDAIIFKLLDSFLETYPQELQVMQRAIEERDYLAIESAAHSLKGSAGNMKFFSVEKLTREIEESSRKREEVDYKALFEELTQLFDQLKSEIEILPQCK